MHVSNIILKCFLKWKVYLHKSLDRYLRTDWDMHEITLPIVKDGLTIYLTVLQCEKCIYVSIVIIYCSLMLDVYINASLKYYFEVFVNVLT